jgi:hypothetical protein
MSGVRAVAWLPHGRFAVLRASELLLEPSGRRLLALTGPLRDLVVAPGGRHLLVSAAGQWLLLNTAGTRLTVLDRIGRQFGGAGALPRPLGWVR